MTRTGVNILLIGLLLAGLGGALYLLVPFLPIDIQLFETAVLLCWGIGAALVVIGGAVAGIGKATSRRAEFVTRSRT